MFCCPRAQEFVGSVSALLRVRQGTVSLKHRVVELNEDVQKSGGSLTDKVSRYSSCKVLHWELMVRLIWCAEKGIARRETGGPEHRRGD